MPKSLPGTRNPDRCIQRRNCGCLQKMGTTSASRFIKLKTEIGSWSKKFNFHLVSFLDKNPAHQAEEAMKKVTQAKEILTDPIERRRYDQSFMREEEQPEQPNQNMQEDDDVLFNIYRDDQERNWWDTQVAEWWSIFNIFVQFNIKFTFTQNCFQILWFFSSEYIFWYFCPSSYCCWCLD